MTFRRLFCPTKPRFRPRASCTQHLPGSRRRGTFDTSLVRCLNYHAVNHCFLMGKHAGQNLINRSYMRECASGGIGAAAPFTELSTQFVDKEKTPTDSVT